MTDVRTPEAKKWPDDFIPPQTCGAIDDVQNALEALRDANAQLRHAAHHFKRTALTAHAETKQAIIAAFAREGIESKGKDGWIGKPCPNCKGRQFVASESSPSGEATCGACGGTGEWYIPSLDERPEA